MTFETLQTPVLSQADGQGDIVFKGYRYTVAEACVSCVLSHGDSEALSQVLVVVKAASNHYLARSPRGSSLFTFEGSGYRT